jgi:hypothetical protein
MSNGSEADDIAAWERPPLDAPELVVVAALVVTAILVVAGVVAGIVIGTSTEPGAGSVAALAAEYATAQWAGVLNSFLLLGALGVCWWRHGEWRDLAGDNEALEMAAAQLARLRRLALAAMVGMLLTVLGSVASVVGRLDSIESFGALTVATVWVPGIAETLGTVTVAVTGFLIGGRLIAPGLGEVAIDEPG